MKLDPNSCYQAMLTHDTRFDGTFYVGVSTTGIYCRPVCTARAPRQERCTFYPSAAAAERAGYRPCLRCRPELAPGSARVDAAGRLAASASDRIAAGALTQGSIEELAGAMGVSARHLRRIIESEFGVSPASLAQTQRLLLARHLLIDTNLSVTEAAFASGFSSLRRFNTLFKERYRMTPTDLRRVRPAATQQMSLCCEAAYRPPLDWDALLRFFIGRASSGVETVMENRYLRAVEIGGHRGWIEIEPSTRRKTLVVRLSASLAPALLPIMSRVKRLFDLAADPQQIAAHLGSIAATRPGLRVPGAFDGFEVAVRAVLGQQISVRAATTLAGRFAAAFGEAIETPYPALARLPPTAERVAQATVEEIIELGIVAGRARSILELARAVGLASGRNPISIVVPCHRVIGSGGQLTGYAGGLDNKARLLRLESGARGGNAIVLPI